MKIRGICQNIRQIIVLSGATASGKSEIVSRLNNNLNIEIIVADSVQIRKHLNVGANKPTIHEMKQIPHHLVDSVDTSSFFSARDYIDAIHPVLSEMYSRKEFVTPFIVGGNTMWIDWLVHGVPDAPAGSKSGKQEAQQLLKNYVELNQWDEAVSMISQLSSPKLFQPPTKNDWHRLHRFLEIILAEKNPSNEDNIQNISPIKEPSIFQSSPFNECDIRYFFLCDERYTLYRNIEKRCETMIEMGLIEEVCELLLNKQIFYLPENTSGYTDVSPVISASIGYRQTINYLLQDDYQMNNSKQFSNYLRMFSTATRNYAKKQLHWYRNQESFLWLHPRRKPNSQQSNDRIINSVVKELHHWITSPREEYINMLNYQVQQSNEYNQQLKDMKKKTRREYYDQNKNWSAEEHILRGCEGNIDPELLRRHIETFKIESNRDKLEKVISIADICRRKLERNACRGSNIKEAYLLLDN